jgi:RNA polymerase sigma-70 factor, ECF subfamily
VADGGRQYLLYADEDLMPLVETGDAEAFAETWKNTQQEQVREALNTLPPEQLKILELAYFSGHTHVEIAERLDLPLGTVKGRIRLGLQKIRGFFQARGAAVPR